MDNHVKSPLHEGGIDSKKWLHAPGCHAGRKEGRMLFRDAHVEKTILMTGGKLYQAGSCWHGCRDRHDLAVMICEVAQGFS